MLSDAVRHLVAFLLKTYVEEGVLFHMGLTWFRQALERAITNGTRTYTCYSEMTAFIYTEMQWRSQDGFSILLPAEDVVQMFEVLFMIYCITAVPHSHYPPRLILDL